MSTEQQLAQLITEVTALKDVYNQKIGAINDRVDLAEQQIDTFIAGADARLGGQNLLVDSGRFCAAAERYEANITNFELPASSLFSAANAEVVIAEGPKFIQNSSSFGGGGAAVDQEIVDLMAAIGREGIAASSGSEFYTLRVTQSPNIAGPQLALLNNGFVSVVGARGEVTFLAWIRVLSGEASFTGNLAKNGDDFNGSLVPADGWTHVAVRRITRTGRVFSFPSLQLGPSDEVLLAIPAVLSSDARGVVHGGPIA